MPALSPPDGQRSILKADSRLRVQVLALLAVSTIVGVIVIVALQHYLKGIEEMAENEPERAIRQVFNMLRLSMGAGGFGLLVFGLHLGKFSMRAVAEKQYPPSGTRVLRDTRILEGDAAKRRGRFGLALSVMLLTIGVALPWFPDLVLRPLFRDIESPPPGANAIAPGKSAPGFFSPELHTGAGSLRYPGLGETGPGPSAFNSPSTSA